MKNRVIIFGEMHTKEDRDRVENEIIQLHKKLKFKFLLTEEAGSLVANTNEEKDAAIKDRHYSISPRSFELGKRLNIPVVGIDNWNENIYAQDVKTSNGEYVDCRRSFFERELRMTATIKCYGNIGNCAVIVGDSHLRGIPNKVMGDISVIQKKYLGESNISIIRSPIAELDENGIVVLRPFQKDYRPEIFEQISVMANALSADEDQYGDKRYNKFFPPSKINFNPAYFCDDPKCKVYCSVVENRIVSFAHVIDMDDRSFKISMLFTDPSHRRQGHARKLFDYIFSLYPKDKFIGFIGTRIQNKNAIAFYESYGFKPYHISLSR